MIVRHIKCAFQDSFLTKMLVSAVSSSESPRPLESSTVVDANNAPQRLTGGLRSPVGTKNNQCESDLSRETMQQNEVKEQSAGQAMTGYKVNAITPAQSDIAVLPPTEETPCPTCAGGGASAAMSYVYAIGRIKARFPRLSVEKEFAQAIGRAETVSQTDQENFYKILSKPENRYLARQMCWVLTIQGFETYILHPRDPRALDRLVEAIRPQPSPMDIDVVIGARGPIAPPEFCNGLMVPIVIFDQVYSFDRDALIKAIPRPEKMTEQQFQAAAGEVFDKVLQMTDNAGATDDHRALNYLAMRYPAIYTKTAEQFARDFSLTGVEVRPSTLRGTRNIVEVIFAHTDRKTDFTEKFCVRVDVTEEFPFLVEKRWR